MNLPRIALASLAAAICLAQPPSFEVASIKPNRDGPMTGFSEDISPNGVFTSKNLTLWNLIRAAYSLRDNQISGGPPWINNQGFDIQAKPAPGGGPIPRDQVNRMLRTLLEDRFQLKTHRETRDTSGYVLTVARDGPKLHPPGEGRQNGTMGDLYMPTSTIEGLCQILEFELGRPVANHTGLSGSFELRLQWASEKHPIPDNPLPSLFTAIQEQLGLKLESQKVPVEVLVIDSVQQPSEN
jgi:uncharacterized protein (TIGR03435 family)